MHYNWEDRKNTDRDRDGGRDKETDWERARETDRNSETKWDIKRHQETS